MSGTDGSSDETVGTDDSNEVVGVCPPKYAPTGNIAVSPWVAGIIGDISDTETTSRHPERRRVVMDDSGLSYHNPKKLETHHDMILTTEETARDRGAVACTKCFGGKLNYDYQYAEGMTI